MDELIIIIEGRRLLIRCNSDDVRLHIEEEAERFGSLAPPQDQVPSDKGCGMHILLVDTKYSPSKVKQALEETYNG